MASGRSGAGGKPDGFETGRLSRVSIGVPPPPPFHTSRPRLFELLDQRRRITTVFGPAGFGKTTLISGWLAESANTENAAWIALDEDLGDGHLLAEQWLEAIRHVRPNACEVAYAMVHDHRIVRPRAIFTSMLNELARQKARWTFVLDDYPVKDPRLDDLIAFICEGSPANVDIILLSRGEPSLPLGRWRVSHKLTEIGLGDLRFTPDETRAFLTEAMNVRLREEDLELLERRVDGWAAGIQLSALWINGRNRSSDRTEPGADETGLDLVSFDGRHRFVAEYLANEVLANQDEATRRFLIATSVVDRFTASLCDAILDGHESSSTLHELRKRALFVVALDDQKEWYRYHHLFRDFLRSHVEPARAIEIHSRASSWFERAGHPNEAIKHAIAAGDPDRAAELVQRHADDQLGDGEFHQLLRWLNALPENVIRRNVELSAYKAWLLYLRGQPGEAEAFFDKVAANGDPENAQSGPLLAFKAYLAINRGRIKEAEQAATAAIESLAGSRSFFSGLAMLLLGTAQRISGDRARAISTLWGAVRLAESHGNLMVRLEATSDLVPLKAAAGKLQEAARLCERAIEETGDAPRGLTTTGPLHIRLGQLLYELDDRARAEIMLDRGVELCERLGNVNYVYLGKRHLARLAYANGQTKRAYELLGDASQFADRAEHGRQRSLVDVVEAEFRLRDGNVAAAAALIGDATEWAEKATEFEQFIRARLLLAQDRPRAADTLLARVESDARDDGRLGGVFTSLLLRTLAAEIRGEKATAERRLIEALSLGGPAGYVRRLLDLGAPIHDVLQRVESRSPFAVQYLDCFDQEREDEAEGAASGLLTGTEQQILELLSRGMSNRDIAKRLGITVGTAKWHIHHIYQKLDVASRTAAVYRAREIRLIEG
ncbi:LuxR C-terminal-related transcriptional regulator [Methylopila sp. M107]|uniref:LuxR C-terminal-related transcriptional regulator n=1 Tax=Methylopila sp. M107 TaxID=1101190 RepID=UPI00036CB7A8|nr:LuxR C-terminal-related transcriptional regulator [Methylopila sp. M107]